MVSTLACLNGIGDLEALDNFLGSEWLRMVKGGVVADRSNLIYLRNFSNGLTKSVSMLNLLCDMLGGSTRFVCLDLTQLSRSI